MKFQNALLPLLAIGLIFGFIGCDQQKAAAKTEDLSPKHKVVIQVSSADEATQTLALNNVVNLQKEMGMDNVTIELVAYGPGLSILTANSTQTERVKSLAMQDITFSACANTMKKVAAKTGKDPVLTEGVGVVPGGVIRIMELQEAGYTYLRP